MHSQFERVHAHGTDTLVMERALDCLRSKRTRNELANSKQSCRAAIRLVSRLRAEVLPRCAAHKMMILLHCGEIPIGAAT